jgi:EAL domain-containing protein (putative c-di-GMP-specific phosphodiesterase class I)
VVALAHHLDMRVVAEGVETDEQHESVLTLGCDYYQGYRFSSSVSSQAFCDLVEADAAEVSRSS